MAFRTPGVGCRFFRSQQHTANISDVDDQDDSQNRFSTRNREVETQRIVFDVSDLPVGPVGPVVGVPQSDSSEEGGLFILEELRRDLFPDRLSPALLDQPHSFEDENSISNANQVTIMGSTQQLGDVDHNVQEDDHDHHHAIANLEGTTRPTIRTNQTSSGLTSSF
jgi:hypothetical protein